MVHRDFKTANVLLAGSRSNPKVSDFGLARLCEGLSAAEVPFGEEENAVDDNEDTFEAAVRRRDIVVLLAIVAVVTLVGWFVQNPVKVTVTRSVSSVGSNDLRRRVVP